MLKDIFTRTLEKEVQGDANNLKGTDYHLLYVMWIVIVEGSCSAAFFLGNDLLAKPVWPLSPVSEDSQSAAARVYQSSENLDIWIQLKATHSNWSLSKLLDKSLLRNFVLNSLLSDAVGRKWRTKLVTTALIDRSEIEAFISDPYSKPNINAKLERLIEKLHTDLSAEARSSDIPSRSEITERACKILGQIAECQTVHREVIVAQLRERATRITVDAQVTEGVLQQAYGAILMDAVRNEGEPRTYDQDWFHRVTGTDLSKSAEPEQSIPHLCDEQVRRHLTNAIRRIPRVQRYALERALNQFVDSEASVFILEGRSTTGKSVATSGWLSGRNGTTRLVIPASCLAIGDRLETIVGRAIPAIATDGAKLALRRLVAAANSNLGPLILVLDDLRPSIEHRKEYAAMIARISDEANSLGIKLVFTCQSDFVTNLNPFVRMDRHFIYRLHRDDSREATISSYVLGDFDDDELLALANELILEDRLAEQLFLKLRDPSLNALRNPSLLAAILVDEDGNPTVANDFTTSIGDAAEKRRSLFIAAAAADSGHESYEVETTFACLLEFLWETYPNSVPRGKIMAQIGQRLDDVGRQCLTSLYHTGGLNDNRPEKIADRSLWARSLSQYLHTSGVSAHRIHESLSYELDQDLVAQFVATAEDSIACAEDFIALDDQWCGAVAQGLVFCDSNDVRIFAMLKRLSRLSNDEYVHSAIGRFALRSLEGKAWLRRLFLSEVRSDRFSAGFALWFAFQYAPDTVRKLVQIRVRLVSKRLSPSIWIRHKKDDTRDYMAEALESLGNTTHKPTALRQRAILEGIKPQVESILLGIEDNDARAVHTDKLLQTYDAVYGQLTSVSGEDQFNQLLTAFGSGSHITLARSINVSARVSSQYPQFVKSLLLETIATCSFPLVLSRALWYSYNLLQSDADAVLEAFRRNRKSIWASYETTAAALSLLEEAASIRHDQVSELMSDWTDGESVKRVALSSDLACLVHFRCHLASGEIDITSIESALRLSQTWEEGLEFHRCRTAIVLWFLEFCIPTHSTNFPLIHRIGYRKYGSDFFAPYVHPWVRDLAIEKVEQSRIEQLFGLLSAMTHAAKSIIRDPLDKFRLHTSYILERDSIGAAMELLSVQPHLWSKIENLGSDWQQLYAAKKLLKKGHRSEGIVTFTLNECERKHRSSTPQASSERSDCLAMIAKFAPDRVPSPGHEKNGIAAFLTGGLDRAKTLAALLDSNDRELLANLESFIQSKRDLSAVRGWHKYAEGWKSIAISDAFNRSFEFRRMGVADSKFHLRTVIAALEVLPNSKLQSEYLDLYRGILSRFDGEIQIEVDESATRGALHRSHILAAKIVATADEVLSLATLEAYLSDCHGRVDDHSLKLNDDRTLSNGEGTKHFVTFFFPAVRFALAAVGHRARITDICHDWGMARRKAELAVKEIVIPSIPAGEELKKAISKLQKLNEEIPNQDAICATLGLLLLTDNDLDAAEQFLKEALALASCGTGRRVQSHCNLACIYARKSSPTKCEAELRTAMNKGQIDKDWIENEKDLDKFRAKDWFIQLINEVDSD